jgi:hypothetical protein
VRLDFVKEGLVPALADRQRLFGGEHEVGADCSACAWSDTSICSLTPTSAARATGTVGKADPARMESPFRFDRTRVTSPFLARIMANAPDGPAIAGLVQLLAPIMLAVPALARIKVRKCYRRDRPWPMPQNSRTDCFRWALPAYPRRPPWPARA